MIEFFKRIWQKLFPPQPPKSPDRKPPEPKPKPPDAKPKPPPSDTSHPPRPPRKVDLNLDEHAARSLAKRNWTKEQIQETVEKGMAYPAMDKTAEGAAATRYVHPTTGKSVVVNNETGKVIHLGGEGFKYE
jgi:hypothetical protein